MNTDTLFFIPDISGFTDFVNHTEAKHSSHIITELIEGIMEKNTLGLELAEVEGDALFYYKKGKLPQTSEVMEMAREMFIHFHHLLLPYKERGLCHCGACSSVVDLSLKFVIHKGQSEEFKVGGRVGKPFGKDVILAHQLLKNGFQGKQYLLLTESIAKDPLPGWVTKQNTQKSLEQGLPLTYVDIEELLEAIPAIPQVKCTERTQDPVVVEDVVTAELNDVYELISNLEYRVRWKKGAENLDYHPNHVNRLGEKHKCFIDGNMLELETVTADFGEGTVVFGEKATNMPLIKSILTYFVMQPLGAKTKLRIETHFKTKGALGFILKPIIRRKIEKLNQEILQNIQQVVNQKDFLKWVPDKELAASA